MATVGSDRHPFSCQVCQGSLFTRREVKINTTGAEFFNMGWANQSATGLACLKCGYLHTFMTAVELWQADHGYPADAAAAWGG